MSIAVVAIVAGLSLAGLAGWLLTRNAGVLRETTGTAADQPAPDGLALAADGPTVVHFSATWCGPCTQVRRVVDRVCADLGGVAHLEVDIDTNPAVARALSVLSLPTTLIFDAGGQQRYRTAGVPTAADLRAVLEPLLT